MLLAALAKASVYGPENYEPVGGLLFFSASDGVHGHELWASDGTEAGTVLVKDVRPGPAYAFFDYRTPIADVNGTAFFIPDDGANGRELWKSDGTEGGTALVKDIQPGPGHAFSNGTTPLEAVNGTLFLAADDGTHGKELWKSDGTETGTVLVKDIVPGPGDAVPSFSHFTNVNGVLYFVADDVHGWELWKSDGTEAGTVLVKDIWPGAESAEPGGFTVVNGTLFFVADDGVHGAELWRSDGTEVGTVLVKDINPGPGHGRPFLTNIDGTLFMNANDGVHGQELWKSDGTEAGTVLVKEIRPGAEGYGPTRLTDVSGTLLFVANDGVHGDELWKSDGTAAGTILVKDILLGGNGGIDRAHASVISVNGTLLFPADDGTHGKSLWKSDGTGAGTVLVKEIRPGLSVYSPLRVIDGTLFLAADDGVHGLELWKSDGTESGTVLVKDIWPGKCGHLASDYSCHGPGDSGALDGRLLAVLAGLLGLRRRKADDQPITTGG